MRVDVIAGFRSKYIVILEEEFKAACNELLTVHHDDGTYGEKGFVTDKPRASSRRVTRPPGHGHGPCNRYEVRVQDHCRDTGLNPIMVDGTGMRRLPRDGVGGQVKFAGRGLTLTAIRWTLTS